MPASFADRRDAGRRLAEHLSRYAGRPDVIVLGLPRGGVPVAFEVALALAAPLDVFVVRKLGAPGHEELAMGAIASGGVIVRNDEVVRGLRIEPEELEAVARVEAVELARRERIYRAGRPLPDLAGRVVLLVDDGLATGSTMRAAVAAVRQHEPRRVVVAVPVASPETCREFGTIADECRCVLRPESLQAVGLWYDNFSQTSDAEVEELLAQAREERGLSDPPPTPGAPPPGPSEDIRTG